MTSRTAQLVEVRTSTILEVTGWNPFEVLIFFRFLPSNCLNWKIYCNDHSSLSSTTAVHYEFHNYIFHIISLHGKIQTQQINLAPNVCMASQLSWLTSHRYRRGYGLKSRWSPAIFQASSFQLLKLENLLRSMIILHFQHIS